jgi:VIT1/CCC1 family predicted Fe2+/Mn2+ transporter
VSAQVPTLSSSGDEVCPVVASVGDRQSGRGNVFPRSSRWATVAWMKLLGGLAALGVLVGALGSLTAFAPALPATPAAAVGLALVVAAMAGVLGAGLLGRSTGQTPYW